MSRSMPSRTLAIWAAVAGGLAALAAPNPKRIVARVNEATKQVHAVSYHARTWGEGSLKGIVHASGEVRALGSDENSLIGLLIRVDAAESGKPGLRLVQHRDQFMLLDDESKTYYVGNWSDAAAALGVSGEWLWMVEFIHPTPFEDELNADELRYEGQQEVAGVKCHVIYVIYAGGRGESRWYFGVEDNLPHRVDRIFVGADGQHAIRVLELRDLKINPSLSEKEFVVTPPDDYNVASLPFDIGERARQLLARGTPAPDWTLPRLAGGQLGLASDLRGKVVVLAFWSSWCRPCRAELPMLAELRKHFADRPVEIVAVHIWEQPRTDLAAFVKSHGPRVTVLRGDDRIARAYRVTGIPCYYVIGPQGRIVFGIQGAARTNATALKRAVEQALEAGPAGEAAP